MKGKKSSFTVFILLQICEGHTDFINSIAFLPENGDGLVSTGDDHTCRMWNQEGEQQGCFQLSSPGMSVCVHEKEPGKVCFVIYVGMKWI